MNGQITPTDHQVADSLIVDFEEQTEAHQVGLIVEWPVRTGPRYGEIVADKVFRKVA